MKRKDSKLYDYYYYFFQIKKNRYFKILRASTILKYFVSPQAVVVVVVVVGEFDFEKFFPRIIIIIIRKQRGLKFRRINE